MAYDLDDLPTQTILAFIRQTETGRSDRASYDVMYGHKQIVPKLTALTIDQAIAAGPSWTRNHVSSAAGAYQFMNATLKDLKRQLSLTGKEVLGPQFQDFLGLTLLNRRGYQGFMAGTISVNEFAKRLAMEWASFPVLVATKGQHRQISRGQSYYAGDGLNKALVSAERIEAVLKQIRAERGVKVGAAPAPAPKPAIPVETIPESDQPATPVGMLVAFLLAMAAAVFYLIFMR